MVWFFKKNSPPSHESKQARYPRNITRSLNPKSPGPFIRDGLARLKPRVKTSTVKLWNGAKALRNEDSTQVYASFFNGNYNMSYNWVELLKETYW